jgi:hypothetical protein
MVLMMSSKNIFHNPKLDEEKSESEDAVQKSDFFEIEYFESEKTPWEKLWLGVLLQQFKDAHGLENSRAEIRNDAKRAINWLWRDSEDFDDVCILAGFDPSFTKLRVQRWLKKQYPILLRDGWFVPPDLGTLKRRT